tara:strand:- start:269 stop:712 length:444 start_codon:yes stop_codon:yes gene_type:complete
MAGRPVLRKLLKDIETDGGFEKICEKVEEGGSIAGIAKHYGVSRKFLSEILNKDPSQKLALANARKNRGEWYAQEALRIADEVEEDSNAINKARERIKVRQWLASAENPERYGSKQNTVTISIGEMHLNALKKINQETIEDAEVIDN